MRAFTLLELVVAIFLFFLLTLFLSQTIYQARNIKLKKTPLIFTLSKVIQADILNAKNITVKQSENSDFSRLYLKTSNSLHQALNGYVYVIYYISKKNNTLLRLESTTQIKLPAYKENYFLDRFLKGVGIFKVYFKNGRYFVFIQEKKPLYFEIYKGEQ